MDRQVRILVALFALIFAPPALAQSSLVGTALRIVPQASVPPALTLGRVGLWSSTAGPGMNLPIWRKADGTDLNLSIATSLQLDATVGTWLEAIVTQGPTSANFLKYTPNDAGTTSWYEYATSSANSGGRRNQIRQWGWNLNGGSGRVTSGALNGAMGWSLEQYYEAPAKLMEGHFIYVDPADTETRLISALGALEAPYGIALYLNASTITMGSGNNNTALPSFLIAPTTTTTLSPDGYNKLTLDNNAGGYINLQAGSLAMGANRASLGLFADGSLRLDATTTLKFYAANNLAYEQGSNYLKLYAPANNNTFVNIDDGNYFLFAAGGGYRFQIMSDRVLNTVPYYPAIDMNTGSALGAPNQRFPWVGVAVPVASLPTCDSTTGGFITVAQGGGGVADILKACMKNAGGTYAWRDVFAP